jgi:hypothetical protein
MIDAVSTQWGVDATETGKTMWAEFADSSRRHG